MAENNFIKHLFVSGKSDGPDSTLVRPSNWNRGLTFANGINGQILVYDNTQDNNMRWVDGTKAFTDLQSIANPTTSPQSSVVSIDFTSTSPIVIVAAATYLGITTVGAANVGALLYVNGAFLSGDNFASGVIYFTQRIGSGVAGVQNIHVDLNTVGNVNFTGGQLYLTVLAFGV